MEVIDWKPEQLMHPNRVGFYEQIRSNVRGAVEDTRLQNPDFGLRTVVAGATGGRIADILLTTPLEENAVIYMVDNGKFFADEPYKPQLRQAYFNMYKNRSEKGKMSLALASILDGMSAGRQDMINWELEALGVEVPTWYEVESDLSCPMFECEFEYQHPGELPSKVRLRFIKGYTNDVYQNDDLAERYFEGRGIDLQLIKGAQQAFEDDYVLGTLFTQLNRGGLVVTDQSGIFDRNRVLDVFGLGAMRLGNFTRQAGYVFNGFQLSPSLLEYLQKGFLFGYEPELGELVQLAIVRKEYLEDLLPRT